MTPKVKVKVKKEAMGKGEMTGKSYPKKELDKMEKRFSDGMQKEWLSRPGNKDKYDKAVKAEKEAKAKKK